MAKFYYKTSEKSEIGQRLSSFWRECQKAEKAAEVYARNMGATQFFFSPEGFTGGVEWLVFDLPDKVDGERWKEGEPIDGLRVWKPNVMAVIKPGGNGKMRVIYDSPFKEAKTKLVNGKRTHLKYSNRPNKHSNSYLFAVRAEKERMKLPVVSIESLLCLLQLRRVSNRDNKSMAELFHVPAFFAYRGDYYISCDDPSESKDMELINFEKYRYFLNTAINAQNKREAAKREKESATDRHL